VTEIPLNGRDFQSLMRTLPGVVSNDTSDFRLAFNNTNAFNVNGQRGSSNNVFLDGAINTDLGANDGQYTQVSLDAVGEFKLQTSAFNAEYGRNPGVMISINTKSGGSTYHGTVYEFLRNNASTPARPSTPPARFPNCFNQFGANLGGPSRAEEGFSSSTTRAPGHPPLNSNIRRYCQPADSEWEFPAALPHECGWFSAVDRRRHGSGRNHLPAGHGDARFLRPRHRRRAVSK
jgi:hypothetical protein